MSGCELTVFMSSSTCTACSPTGVTVPETLPERTLPSRSVPERPLTCCWLPSAAGASPSEPGHIVIASSDPIKPCGEAPWVQCD